MCLLKAGPRANASNPSASTTRPQAITEKVKAAATQPMAQPLISASTTAGGQASAAHRGHVHETGSLRAMRSEFERILQSKDRQISALSNKLHTQQLHVSAQQTHRRRRLGQLCCCTPSCTPSPSGRGGKTGGVGVRSP